MKRGLRFFLIWFGCSPILLAEPASSSAVADRAAVERVYYEHRLGNKPPFDEALSAAAIEKMVRAETKREAALRRIYRFEIGDAEIAEEVKRIESTTRAPEVLSEIKGALGNDAARFVRAVARPIIVERELRTRFENDDQVHAPQRGLAEAARIAALAARESGFEKQADALRNVKAGTVHDAAWELTPRLPAAENRSRDIPASGPSSAKAASASYSNEASVEVAQSLAAPPAPNEERTKVYFEDLPKDLQQVLRAQLKKPGDVSAVIETPAAFLVFVAREISAETLSAAALSIPKRDYETWLAEQPDTDS